MPISPAETALRKSPDLVADNVVAGYGGAPIVRGASVEVAPGEGVSIVGPNGAGKSTLLKAIAGLLRVESGSIRLRRREITNLATHRLARMGLGYVPQNNDVFEPLTVLENLEMGGYLLSRSETRGRV